MSFLGKSFLSVALAFGLRAAAEPVPTLINGTPVEPGTYQEVVQVSASLTSTSVVPCTATIVGPNAIVTAAHCVPKKDAKVKVKIGDASVLGTPVISPLFKTNDHDLAVIFVDDEIKNIKPAVIGGKAAIGVGLKLLGYGCTQAQGGGGSDGILRIGESVIVGVSNYDMVSKKANGGAICYGDSGGPAYATQDGKTLLLGVNSKGNIADSNWNTRLDTSRSIDFLKQAAEARHTTICGVNSKCDNIDPPPPPDDKPSCTLTANPNTVKAGGMLTLSLISTNATAAKIEGKTVSVPTDQINIPTSAEGTFTARAEVTGKNGSVNTCSATYKVEKNDSPPPPPQDRPTCTLTASAAEVKPNQTVTLELVAQGQVNYASIDSKAVSYPVGKLMVTPKAKGDYSATGFVRGPAGSSNCFADYKVTDDGGSAPSIPPYAVVPAYCGENELLDTRVYKVCVGVVRKDDSMPDLKLGQVLLITYSDSTKEVLPILSRKTRPKGEGETQVKEDLTLFANKTVDGPDYVVLDTRTATLTKLPPATPSSGEVPIELEGRTATGKYFLVRQLSAQASAMK